MPEMLHEITIEGSTESVTDALTTQDRLRMWWTDDCTAASEVGSQAVFGFHNRATVFEMRVDEIVLGQRVVWSCTSGPDEWVGTQLTWLVDEQNGKSRLRFTHAGWKSTDGMFALCNTTWGHLMVVLKQYVEGHNPGPYFKG